MKRTILKLSALVATSLLAFPVQSEALEQALFLSSWDQQLLADDGSNLNVTATGSAHSQGVSKAITNGFVGSVGNSNFRSETGSLNASGKIELDWGPTCLLRGRVAQRVDYDFGDDFGAKSAGISGSLAERAVGGGCSYSWELSHGRVITGGFAEAVWFDHAALYASATGQTSDRSESGMGFRSGSVFGYHNDALNADISIAYSTGLAATLDGETVVANSGVVQGTLDSELSRTFVPPRASVIVGISPSDALRLSGKLSVDFWNAADAPVYIPTSSTPPAPMFAATPEEREIRGNLSARYAFSEKLAVTAAGGFVSGSSSGEDKRMLFPSPQLLKFGLLGELKASDRISIGFGVEGARSGTHSHEEAGVLIDYKALETVQAHLGLTANF